MLILGISSAVQALEVALVEEQKVLVQYSSSRDIRTENLVKYIDCIFAECRRKISELSAVAVTVGPGSYGGLRGGLAVAKGLSQASGVSIIGVSTLEAIAHNMEEIKGLVIVAAHACKDEYNVAAFGGSGDEIRRVTEDFVVSGDLLSTVLAKVSGEIHLASARTDIFLRIKNLNPQTKIKQAGAWEALPHAAVVAKLGMEELKKGKISDYLTLSPHYSHEPNIREYKSR